MAEGKEGTDGKYSIVSRPKELVMFPNLEGNWVSEVKEEEKGRQAVEVRP